MLHRAHHAHETHATLRAVDAPNDRAVTCNTWLALGVADNITRHPVRAEGGAYTRLGLSNGVDQHKRDPVTYLRSTVRGH